MTEKINIKEKIDEGWIRSKILFEIAGKPKEHIVKSLKDFIESIKKNESIIFIKEDEGSPQFQKEEDVWSTFTEVEMLVEGIEKFVYICVTFTPANIEILEPKQLTFTEKNLTDWLNELLSLLHHLGMKNKQQASESQLHMRNLQALAKNSILLALEFVHTEDEIATKTGINKEVLEQFLKLLISEDRVVLKVIKDEKLYYIKE